MSYYVVTALGLFVVVPAIIAAFRLPDINPVFDPFIISIWVNAFNVFFSSAVDPLGYYNIVPYNIWFLLDAFIMLWLFKKWNLFESKKLYHSLWILLGIFWLVETIFFSKLIGEFNSYFRILYCFIVILMSISTINSILMKERINLMKNSMFLICCTFVLLNTITVIGESFFASNLQLGNTFRISMDRLITYTNLLCNIIFSLIIVWMPKKQAFMLQY
jgi:hypothetical protein